MTELTNLRSWQVIAVRKLRKLLSFRCIGWRTIVALIICNFVAFATIFSRPLGRQGGGGSQLPNIAIGGPPSFCAPFDVSSPEQHRDIFFLETTGEACLTPRQACSVESAAIANPHMTITVYTNTDAAGRTQRPSLSRRASTQGNERNCEATQALTRLSNVVIKRRPLADELRGTLLWDRWYDKGMLVNSQYPHVHLSDALRVAILQKRGGIYLDLDCIVLRPLHCLRNTAASLSNLDSWVENGVLSFDRSHPFLTYLTRAMVQLYRPDMRESMGPPTLGVALKFYCDIRVNASFQHSTTYHCKDGQQIRLEPTESFYAIPALEHNKFVERKFDNTLVRRLDKSYLSHVYFHTRHKVPLSSLYGSLARQYCPSIYHQFLQHDF